MAEPKDKYTDGSNDPNVFANLPPSTDGTPRASSSDFPAEIDHFVVLEDNKDEKWFARYVNDMVAALLATQTVVKEGGGGGGPVTETHEHAEYDTNYTSDVIPLPVGKKFKSNSTMVFLRGRKLVLGSHYTENSDGKGITLTLSSPEGAVSGDSVDIEYIEDLVVTVGHLHYEKYHVYDGGNLITVLSEGEYVSGSTMVYLRGRKLVRNYHYVEAVDLKSIQLTMSPPEAAVVDDVIEIEYIVEISGGS